MGFWYLDSTFKFSNQPTAEAPSTIGIARPIAKTRSKAAPNNGDRNAAAAPINATSAGLHTGHTATEKTVPSANAPSNVVGRVALSNTAGNGIRSQPAHTKPSSINAGPSRRPH